MKRRVVCVFGRWKENSDFVLEPACAEKCNCEICKNAFWIQDCSGENYEENE